MLVITGSGRCGTSVLAKFCQNVGFVTGGSWNYEINAGMEDKSFVETNNYIYNNEKEDYTYKYIKRFTKLVVKDPRFLRKEVIRIWAKERKDLKLVICVRDMECVTKSFYGSTFFDDRHLKWAVDKTHEMISAYTEIGKHQIPVKFLTFPDFLDTYDIVHEILEWGGLTINKERGRTAWEGLVDKNMVHYK